MMDEATLTRLIGEYNDLKERVIKLEKFIGTNDFNKLPDQDRIDLCEQIKHMRPYLQVLHRRMYRHAESPRTA